MVVALIGALLSVLLVGFETEFLCDGRSLAKLRRKERIGMERNENQNETRMGIEETLYHLINGAAGSGTRSSTNAFVAYANANAACHMLPSMHPDGGGRELPSAAGFRSMIDVKSGVTTKSISNIGLRMILKMDGRSSSCNAFHRCIVHGTENIMGLAIID